MNEYYNPTNSPYMLTREFKLPGSPYLLTKTAWIPKNTLQDMVGKNDIFSMDQAAIKFTESYAERRFNLEDSCEATRVILSKHILHDEVLTVIKNKHVKVS